MSEKSQTPKSLKAQITRASLVLAAAALLREEGPSAVTYRRAAQRANTASSSVGYYFDSIDQLLSEAGEYNIQMWTKRAETAAEEAEKLSVEECRKKCIPLLIQACLPDYTTAPETHYAQLIAAAGSEDVTKAYQKGREALDAAVQRILSRAGVKIAPRLIYAVIDGAAVTAISEDYDVAQMATYLLNDLFKTCGVFK